MKNKESLVKVNTIENHVDVNTNLLKLLEAYGQNLHILGHAVTEVNSKVNEVQEKLLNVTDFVDELRIDHLELKEIVKLAKSIRDRYRNLLVEKSILYDVSTHAVTKVFDYVMYSTMFEAIGKEPVSLGHVNQGYVNMSTKEVTKREFPLAVDFLSNFEIDMERFNNQLYKKYKGKIERQARWTYE